MEKYWNVTEYVDSHTGQDYRIYTYKRKKCKRIVLNSKLSTQLAGYTLIEKDIRSAILWIDEAENIIGTDSEKFKHGSRISGDRERYNIVKAMFVAAITFYGKIFSQCEGRKIKLNKSQIEKEFHEIHDTVIKVRNNFTAHSGSELIETCNVALIIPPKQKNKTAPRIFTELKQPDYMISSLEEKKLKDLFLHVQKISISKREELLHKILNEEVLPKGYAHWENESRI